LAAIVIKARPISINASSQSKEAWKKTVSNAAKKIYTQPLQDCDLRIIITFFYNILPDFDTDNMSKPICDSLKGIVYQDDIQIMERLARRRDVNSAFHIRGIDPEVALAIAEGSDFVSINIEKIGDGVSKI
jgi:hypothetical protein